MNAALEDISKNTFGFPLTCRTLHGMAFDVLQKDFPGLFEDLGPDFLSPVNILAQNHYHTGVANYGCLTYFQTVIISLEIAHGNI